MADREQGKVVTKPKRRRTLLGFVCRVFLGLLVAVFLLWLGAKFYLGQPRLGPFRSVASLIEADSTRLERDVRMLSEQFAPRNFGHLGNTKRTADYIRISLDKAVGAGFRAEDLWFDLSGDRYRNVSLLLGPNNGEPRIVVGAHYDSWYIYPGADDNASGVAGVLELARLLAPYEDKLTQPVELVCFPLEEPPFYGTDEMGSCFHADGLKQEGVRLELMICLEMIGYFSDDPGSQTFPVPGMELFYPRVGNFITVVGNTQNRSAVVRVKQSMKAVSALPVYSICAHEQLPGIDFSDHRNYWEAGYPAVMVTDTAFYRNKAYHTENDTADRLDFHRMAIVVDGVAKAILDLATDE